MTIQTKKVWLLVLQIFMLIDGIVLCLTILGALLGVPAIIGATKFSELRQLDDDSLAKEIKAQKYIGWGILSIFIDGIIGILGFVFVWGLETKKDDVIDVK